jgi:hypothetical protein
VNRKHERGVQAVSVIGQQGVEMNDENRQASPDQERAMADYIERVARALHEAHMPYCDYTYPFDDPMSGAKIYRELARAVVLVAPPTVQ